MNVGDLLLVFRRRWRLIAMLALLGLGVAAAYTITERPTYTSESALFVSTQDATSVTDLSQGSTYTQQIIKSYAAVATKPYVLNGVIEQLGLQETTGELAARVTVTAPVDTVLLYVDVVDSSPTRAAAIANSIASNLIDRVQTLSPTNKSDTSAVRLTLVQRAEVTVRPTSPDWRLNLVLGLAAGVVLALVLGAVRSQIDMTVRSLDELERVTDLPLLGVAIENDASGKERRVVDVTNRSIAAEVYRAISTSLIGMLPGRGSKCLVITSAVELEGKSTVAVNLAAAIAESGRSVLVVDADLRRSSLSSYSGVSGAVGLSDVLSGAVEPAAVFQRTADVQFSVCPAGPIPVNPNALLQRSEFQRFLDVAREGFDTVLIDTPPLLAVSDATIVAKSADGVILVAAAGVVKANQLRQALRRLVVTQGRTLGVVLSNCAIREARRIGFGYSYAQREPDVR